ncbi:MAG: hypothetical protein WC788_04660 [Candidatus Paceibacterota bacterium]
MDIDERIAEIKSINAGKESEVVRMKKELVKLVKEISMGFGLEYSAGPARVISITKWSDGLKQTKINWLINNISEIHELCLKYETAEDLDYLDPHIIKAIHIFIMRDDVVVAKYNKIIAV